MHFVRPENKVQNAFSFHLRSKRADSPAERSAESPQSAQSLTGRSPAQRFRPKKRGAAIHFEFLVSIFSIRISSNLAEFELLLREEQQDSSGEADCRNSTFSEV